MHQCKAFESGMDADRRFVGRDRPIDIHIEPLPARCTTAVGKLPAIDRSAADVAVAYACMFFQVARMLRSAVPCEVRRRTDDDGPYFVAWGHDTHVARETLAQSNTDIKTFGYQIDQPAVAQHLQF